MLKIRNLEAGYDKLKVLKGVSLHVNPGEIVTIIGANGAGKTTLLNTIASIVKPTAGEIKLNDVNVHFSYIAIRIYDMPPCVPAEEKTTVQSSFRSKFVLQHPGSR